jgi:TrmH family RNA methyltransferase
MLTSAQNPRIKLVRALAGRPKERREAGGFLAEGVRLVEEALAASWPFQFALYSDGLSERGLQLQKRLEEKGIETMKVKQELLHSLGNTETSQGILAVLADFAIPAPEAPDFVLILDSIRDPGNLGTLLRSADAAGVQSVLLPPETTDAFAPKVVRAGMGAHFRLPIQAMDWDQIRRITDSLDLRVYLADARGQSCWETDLRQPLALIIGREAEGATLSAHRVAREQLGILMPGRAESLNAAVAGSLLMFEVVRQRGHSP